MGAVKPLLAGGRSYFLLVDAFSAHSPRPDRSAVESQS